MNGDAVRKKSNGPRQNLTATELFQIGAAVALDKWFQRVQGDYFNDGQKIPWFHQKWSIQKNETSKGRRTVPTAKIVQRHVTSLKSSYQPKRM